MKYIFDLIVIGGGHAGIEAALVAKRSGLDVALVTLDKTKTGRMSCNPAIGGIGKSHLTKEIDALGGYMAEATDLSGIQFRTLNKKKGPAVQATRAQTDKNLYEKAIQEKIKKENIQVFDDEIKDFATKKTIIENACEIGNIAGSLAVQQHGAVAKHYTYNELKHLQQEIF